MYNKLFLSEKNNPTAWNAGEGTHSAWMFDSILFSRDEKELVKAAKQHGFEMYKYGKNVIFHRRNK